MLRGDKELLVVGDRVLVRVDEQEQRTEVGLYLPPTALEKENVQSGRIEEVGPGIPLPPKGDEDDVPWAESGSEAEMRFIPLQAQKGDHAIYARKEAVEIKFDNEKFVVVPHTAILVLIRSTGVFDLEPSGEES
ncbi:MAG: co-chaperone GroES family protein [Gemmatimonadaceae bacterium]|nr:co-chaperone GroES family protein [Gemmatimonadaceae bacterium]